MPKMKSNRAAAKRFKRTGGSTIKRSHANRRHILTKKSTKRKRKLRGSASVSSQDFNRVSRMLAS